MIVFLLANVNSGWLMMARWLQKLLQNGHASVVYYVVLYDVVLQYNLEVECGLCG